MKSQQSKLETRFERPQTIASAFGGLMKIFGARASSADLSENWEQILGSDLAKIVELRGVKNVPDKKFNITVHATNPAFALQLSYQKDEIEKRINKYFGYSAINKITIRK